MHVIIVREKSKFHSSCLQWAVFITDYLSHDLALWLAFLIIFYLQDFIEIWHIKGENSINRFLLTGKETEANSLSDWCEILWFGYQMNKYSTGEHEGT